MKHNGKTIPASEVARALRIAEAVEFKHFANESEIETLCKTCHNGMCGEFNFADMWPAIKHSTPKAR
jgi:hypothetical protein